MVPQLFEGNSSPIDCRPHVQLSEGRDENNPVSRVETYDQNEDSFRRLGLCIPELSLNIFKFLVMLDGLWFHISARIVSLIGDQTSAISRDMNPKRLPYTREPVLRRIRVR